MHLLISWLVLSASVWLTAVILPGFELRGGFTGALKVAALFGILQFLLGKLLFFVIGAATLGVGWLLAFLTRWLVSAILLKIADRLSDSLYIVSFSRALWAALLMSGIGTLAERLLQR